MSLHVRYWINLANKEKLKKDTEVYVTLTHNYKINSWHHAYDGYILSLEPFVEEKGTLYHKTSGYILGQSNCLMSLKLTIKKGTAVKIYQGFIKVANINLNEINKFKCNNLLKQIKKTEGKLQRLKDQYNEVYEKTFGH